ncbi:MAG: hypothetical protein HUU10_03650 [Bacteroidetes bacterium]|nr:hypothetical protein [Bacteroidota bacterium]
MEPVATGIREFKATALVTRGMADAMGYLNGADLFKLLELTAHACARRFCGLPVVTAHVDPLDFNVRVRQDTKLTMMATINLVENSSMEIGVKVVQPLGLPNQEEVVTVAFFIVIAVNDDRKPTPLPVLKGDSDAAEQRRELARLRKQLRKEYQVKITELNRLMTY